LNFLHRLLGLLERDRRQRRVTLLQVVDVKSESIPFRPRQLIESPLADRWQVSGQVPQPVTEAIECGESALKDLQADSIEVLILSARGEETRVIGWLRCHSDPSGESETKRAFGHFIRSEAIHIFLAHQVDASILLLV